MPKTLRKRDKLVAAKLPWAGTREWERGTVLIAMFAVTGYIEGVKPQSLILTGDPGIGKTELLERFRLMNPFLSYHSDITMRGLIPILRNAARGSITHIAMTEFQKIFQRRAAVAEAFLGMMVQAMEEGVNVVSIGSERLSLGGARLGIIAAMTHSAFGKKRMMMEEMGFLDRVAMLPWDVPSEEMRTIFRNITREQKDDLAPIRLPPLSQKINVAFPMALAADLESYVWQLRGLKGLRLLNRLRALTRAVALLKGQATVTKQHLAVIYSFADYWERLQD